MDLHEDRAWLDAFRAGDAGALTRLYWALVDDVERMIRLGFSIPEKGQRIAGVSAAGEQRELVQEAFCRAFAPDARKRYDGLRPFRPYVLRIAKNLLVDRARKQGRDLPLDTHDLDTAMPEPEPEDTPEWQAQRQIALAYMQSLGEPEKSVAELRFVACKSQDEIAAALGTSRGKVRAAEDRVHAGLRKLLQKHGFFRT